MTDTTAMQVRKIETHVVDRLRLASQARDMTYAEYITALVKLHDTMRDLADAGNDEIMTDLTALGLQTVER